MALSQLYGNAKFDIPAATVGSISAPSIYSPATSMSDLVLGVPPTPVDGLGTAVGAYRVLHPHMGRSVWAKRNWNDAEWEYVPYVWPTELAERVSPGVSEGILEYDMGMIKREAHMWWAVWNPVYLQRAFVRVLAHSSWSWAQMFCGVVDAETINFDGSTYFPQGRQKFRAYGMEHILDRFVIQGSATTDGYITRPIKFNAQGKRGNQIIGNRSDAYDSDDVYVFGGRNVWTNTQIARYLLTKYTGAANSADAIPWALVGATEALDGVAEVFDLEGLTVYQALNKLIDRRRGLAWRILTDGDGTVFVYVFSVLPFSVWTPEFYLPANPDQSYIRFDARIDAEVSVDFSDCAEYDYIRAKGGPIVTCFSLSIAEGTLEEGWSGFDEVFYNAGTGTPADEAGLHDAKRTTDAPKRVYTAFRVPTAWDWKAGDPFGAADPRYFVTPICLWDGTVDFETEGVHHRPGKVFLRELPLEETTPVNEDDPEYRSPFAIVLTTTEEDDPVYVYVEALDAIGKIPAHVRVGDKDLEVHIRPTKIPHAAALNTFPASPTSATNTEPEYDFNEYIVTVAMETDTHLEVRIAVPPVSPVGREKLISVPDATAWYVLPGTVLDVDDIQANDTTNVLRNDRSRLFNIAILAAAWYGFQRASLQYKITSGINLANPPGTLIRAVANGWHVSEIGTVVTERIFDLENNTTEVRTQFRELEVEAL